MKSQTLIPSALLVLAASTTFAFVFGMKVGSNDAKLFQAHDNSRIAFLERSCGTNSRLIQDARTFAFSCAHINRDGVTLLREVSDSPLLAARR